MTSADASVINNDHALNPMNEPLIQLLNHNKAENGSQARNELSLIMTFYDTTIINE